MSPVLTKVIHLYMDGRDYVKETDALLVVEASELLLYLFVTLDFPLTDKFLAHVVQKCVQLRALEIEDASSITENSLLELPKCTQLENLSLSNCDNISDAFVSLLVEACPRLHTLILSGRQNELTDACLRAIATHCPSLECLRLVPAIDFSEHCMVTLFCSCPKLRYVALEQAEQLTDFCVAVLAAQCPLLEELNLSHARDMTHEGFVDSVQRLPRLRYINITGCRGLDLNTDCALLLRCPALKELNIGRSMGRKEAAETHTAHTVRLDKGWPPVCITAW